MHVRLIGAWLGVLCYPSWDRLGIALTVFSRNRLGIARNSLGVFSRNLLGSLGILSESSRDRSHCFAWPLCDSTSVASESPFGTIVWCPAASVSSQPPAARCNALLRPRSSRKARHRKRPADGPVAATALAFGRHWAACWQMLHAESRLSHPFPVAPIRFRKRRNKAQHESKAGEGLRRCDSPWVRYQYIRFLR